jgi:cytochrome oxidase Cu insertion factor (SCO1/SenC/PrrC family)
MSDNTLKNALIVLVLLLLLVFVWQPLSRLFNAAPITNDFVLDTANGVLDSRNLRGNVLAISFAYAHCEDECSDRLARLAADYVKRFQAEMIGAAAKPEDLKSFAESFAATYRKMPVAPDGTYQVDHNRPIYLVSAAGHFVSALNESLTPEEIAQALRAKLPAQLPPS